MKNMLKHKKIVFTVLAIVLVICWAFFTFPFIERNTWVLYTAQQTDALQLIVAHGAGKAPSNDPLYHTSKEVDLHLEAKKGKLTITDETNDKVYEGTYTVSSVGFSGLRYRIEIGEKLGSAGISGYGSTLILFLDGYQVIFGAQ